MADNTTLNTQSGGDTIRDKDRSGVKTQIVALDLNPAGSESLMAQYMPVALDSQNAASASVSVTLNATSVLESKGRAYVLVQLVQTTTLSAGAINFEITYDDTNWITIPNPAANPDVVDPSTLAQIVLPYTVQASTNKAFLIAMGAARQVRIKTTTGITGSGTVTAYATALSNPGALVQPTKELSASAPTQSSVANSASNVNLLASNANRLGATIFNDDTIGSGATLKVKLGSTASATSFTAAIAPQGYYEVPFRYSGAIDGIASAATGNARITELAP